MLAEQGYESEIQKIHPLLLAASGNRRADPTRLRSGETLRSKALSQNASALILRKPYLPTSHAIVRHARDAGTEASQSK